MEKKKPKKMPLLKPLPPEQLRYTCGQNNNGTDSVKVDPNNNEIYNQERGVAALEFALEVEGKIHAVLVGSKNSGRKSSAVKIIKKITAGKERELKDLALLHNFKGRGNPKSVFLPKGAGKELKKNVEAIPELLELSLRLALCSEEYMEQVKKMNEDYAYVKKGIIEKLNKIVEKYQCVIREIASGVIVTNISVKNKSMPMEDEEFFALDQDVQQKLNKQVDEARVEIEKSGLKKEMIDIEAFFGNKIKKAKNAVMQNKIGGIFTAFKKNLFRLFSYEYRVIEKKKEERAKNIKNIIEKEAEKIGFILVPNMKVENDESNPFCFNIVESVEKENEQKETEETKKEKINKVVELCAKWSEEYEKICKEFRDEYIKAEENAKKNPDENRDRVLVFLDELKGYCFKNIDLFLEKPQIQEPQQIITIGVSEEDKKEKALGCFKINLLVDNTSAEHPVIIDEKEIKFSKLFGEIDSKEERIGTSPSIMSIKAGDFLKANGGYLVLDLYDVCVEHAFQKIISTLKSGKFEFESKLDHLGLSSSSIKPEPIPINLKVVFVVEPWVYHVLNDNSDFRNMFIPAFFNKETRITKKVEDYYLNFAAGCCKAKNLMPFDGSAVAKLVEYGCRLADSQKKTSVQFGLIKKIMIEADYWAKKNGSSRVSAECVKKALEERKKRLSYYEEKYQENIREGTILIDTDGVRVGQINGLSVYKFSEDIIFGKPSKITCQSYAGKEGIVSVQRNIEMSGPSYNMAIEIISAYLNGKYGKTKPIGLSAQISFEQCYGGLDGDSASLAELLAVLSSISGLPIKQNYAITGSMNQFGEAQPIGGVNYKIEGFFDAVKERGLNGKHGVVIPIQNVNDLVLKEEIIEEVRKKMFSIYAVKSIDEAIELFFELPAEEVHKAVKNKIKNKNLNQSLWQKIFKISKKEN